MISNHRNVCLFTKWMRNMVCKTPPKLIDLIMIFLKLLRMRNACNDPKLRPYKTNKNHRDMCTDESLKPALLCSKITQIHIKTTQQTAAIAAIILKYRNIIIVNINCVWAFQSEGRTTKDVPTAASPKEIVATFSEIFHLRYGVKRHRIIWNWV